MAGFVVATLAGLVLLWPSGSDPAAGDTWVKGAITNLGLCPDIDRADCVQATVKLTQADGSKTVHAELPTGAEAPDFSVGDDIVLSFDADAPAETAYAFEDLDRSSAVLVLLAVTVLAIAYLCRWDGIATLVGLALAVVVVVVFVLPGIREGGNGLWLSLVAASLITIVSVYAVQGVNVDSTITTIAVLTAMAVTGLIGSLVTALSDFTAASDPASAYGGADIGANVGDLVLAGILLGVLGAMIDVATTQVAAVWAAVRSGAYQRRSEVFAAAMRKGQAHTAVVVRTLLMAYAAAALPLVFYLTAAGHGLIDIGASGGVAAAIVMGLVGCLGLIVISPLATTIAVTVTNTTIAHGRRKRRR